MILAKVPKRDNKTKNSGKSIGKFNYIQLLSVTEKNSRDLLFSKELNSKYLPENIFFQLQPHLQLFYIEYCHLFHRVLSQDIVTFNGNCEIIFRF